MLFLIDCLVCHYHIDTHLKSPVFLGSMTRGDIHGVGPSTFSIIPCLSRLSSSADMCFLMQKGIQ